jgi:hypothetical protein
MKGALGDLALHLPCLSADAFLQDRITEFLHFLKRLATGVTDVLVNWHILLGPDKVLVCKTMNYANR